MRRCPTSRAGSTASKPDAQLRLFGRVLDRLEHVDDGRVLWSTLTDDDLATTGTGRGALRGDHRPARPGGAGRGRRSCSRSRARRHGSASGPSPAGSTPRSSPGPSAAVATPGPPGRPSIARSTRPASSSSRRPAGWPPGSTGEPARRTRRRARARRDPRRRQAGRPDLARRRRPRPAAGRDPPGRPRRHARSRSPPASCRCSSAGRPASSSTTSGTGRRYRATICFGAGSTTDDLDGELTPTGTPGPDRTAVETALAGLVGPILQVPPAYSAIKLGGRRAYAMARAGETPELAPRAITIDRLELVDWDADDPDRPIAVVEVDCSAGTYVRSIARDVGRATGGAAYLGALIRTASGGFSIAAAHSLEAIRAAATDGPAGLRPLLLPIDAGLERLARVALGETEVAAVGRGQFVRPAAGLPSVGSPDERVIAVDGDGRPVAVCAIREGRLAPDKVLVDAPLPAPVAVGDALNRPGALPTMDVVHGSSRADARPRAPVRRRRRVRRAPPRPPLPARPAARGGPRARCPAGRDHLRRPPGRDRPGRTRRRSCSIPRSGSPGSRRPGWR